MNVGKEHISPLETSDLWDDQLSFGTSYVRSSSSRNAMLDTIRQSTFPEEKTNCRTAHPHCRLSGGHQLLPECVVGLLVPLRQNGHAGTVQDGIPARQPKQRRGLPDAGELVWRLPQLPGSILRPDLL